jgi:uncharacterized protein with HEPN domain
VNERDELRLRHILDAGERIAAYLQGVDQATFFANRMLQDAVIRNLEVIGEACANLSAELTAAHSAIPWNKASGIRNRLVHGYFDVDLRVVWQTARDSIPAFVSQVRSVLDARRGGKAKG